MIKITTNPQKYNVLHQINLKMVNIKKKSISKGIIRIHVKNAFMMNYEDPKNGMKSFIKQSKENIVVDDCPKV